MAIIRCPGCKRRVSSRAGTCADCGAPIGAASPGQARSTRQERERRGTRHLRIQLLAALMLFVIGALWIISANLSGAGNTTRAVPALGLAAIGLFWYLGVRMLLWLRQR